MTTGFRFRWPPKYVIQAALLCAGLLFLTPRVSWSQANSATLHGTVTDATGAMIPGATVTLTHQSTQATMVQTTGTSGDFAFTFVPVGVYTLRIEATGFKSLVRSNVRVDTDAAVSLRLQLEVGQLTEKIDVTTDAAAIWPRAAGLNGSKSPALSGAIRIRAA